MFPRYVEGANLRKIIKTPRNVGLKRESEIDEDQRENVDEEMVMRE